MTAPDGPTCALRVIRAGAAAYRGSATEMTTRSRPELHTALGGLELQQPGLVDVTQWPDTQSATAPVGVYAAVTVVPE